MCVICKEQGDGWADGWGISALGGNINNPELI